MSTSLRNVAQAGAGMALVALACRIVSLGKEVVVAGVFGAGVATDAYGLVVLIPSMGMSVLVLAVRSAFLTHYPRRLTADPSQAGLLVRQFFTGLMLVVLVVVGSAAILLPPLWSCLVAGNSPALLAASRDLIQPAVWALVPIAAVGGLTAVLNARGYFAGPQATAVLPTLTVLVLLALLGRKYGAWTLIVGLAAGSALQAVVLALLVARAGESLRPSLGLRETAARAMFRAAAPMVLLGLLAQLNVYIDRTMASLLPSGSVAVLTWSSLIFDLLNGTMLGSLLWVLLPHFSEQAAAGDTAGLRRSLNGILRAAAVVLWPLSAAVAVAAPVVLGHVHFGQLDRQACGEIGLTLAAYGLGLFAALTGTAMFQTLLALGRFRALLMVAVVASLLPNVVLNLLLLRLGPAGLALSTSLVAVTTLAANRHLVNRHLGQRGERLSWQIVGHSLAVSLLAAAGWLTVIWACRRLPLDTRWADLLGLGIGAAGAVLIYTVALGWLPSGRPTRRMLGILVGRIRRRRAAAQGRS